MRKLRFLNKALPLLCFLILVLSSCSSLRFSGLRGQSFYNIEGKVSIGFDPAGYAFYNFDPAVLLNDDVAGRRVVGVVYHARTYSMAIQMRNRLMGMGMFEEVKITLGLNE